MTCYETNNSEYQNWHNVGWVFGTLNSLNW